jgi:hypothetical protein
LCTPKRKSLRTYFVQSDGWWGFQLLTTRYHTPGTTRSQTIRLQQNIAKKTANLPEDLLLYLAFVREFICQLVHYLTWPRGSLSKLNRLTSVVVKNQKKGPEINFEFIYCSNILMSLWVGLVILGTLAK